MGLYKVFEPSGKRGNEHKHSREFFQHQLPRLLHEIDTELEAVEKRIMGLLREGLTE